MSERASGLVKAYVISEKFSDNVVRIRKLQKQSTAAQQKSTQKERAAGEQRNGITAYLQNGITERAELLDCLPKLKIRKLINITHTLTASHHATQQSTTA